MTKDEAYEKQRQERLALQRQVAKLEKTIAALREGTYVDDEKAKHLKQINKLTLENKKRDYSPTAKHISTSPSQLKMSSSFSGTEKGTCRDH